MKTFKDLEVGDYIYEIENKKVVQFNQVTSIIKYNGFVELKCRVILHNILTGITVRVIFDEELEKYEIIRFNRYTTPDENLFSEHLKQIVDEDV